MGRELLCQDSRDKIYGLLGLAEESLRAQITVDYQNKTVTELYLDVAKHEVANEQMITLLHFANKRNNMGLPSWRPNYGEPSISTLLIAADYHAGTKDVIRRKAISARTTPFRATVDGNVLHVQGFRFDLVDKLVPPGWTKFHHDEENLSRNATQSLAWDEGALSFPSSCPENGKRFSMLILGSLLETRSTFRGAYRTNERRMI
jgi:hypothetical protein